MNYFSLPARADSSRSSSQMHWNALTWHFVLRRTRAQKDTQLMTLSVGGSWVHHVLSMPHPSSIGACVCPQWGQSDRQAGDTSETAGGPIRLNLGPVPPHTQISMCWNTVASWAFQSCCCATPAWLTAEEPGGVGGGDIWREALVYSQLINWQTKIKVQWQDRHK